MIALYAFSLILLAAIGSKYTYIYGRIHLQRSLYAYKCICMHVCFIFTKYNCSPLSDRRNPDVFYLNYIQTYKGLSQSYNIIEILHADADTLYIFR